MLALKWRISVALLLVTILVLAVPAQRQPNAAVASSRLVQAMATGADGAIYKVWVGFQARDLKGEQLVAALDRAEAELHPRAARRRAKMHHAGERLVDKNDLPLNPRTIKSCQATGANLHQQSRWLNAASFYATADQIAELTQVTGVQRVSLVGSLQRAGVPTPVGRVEDRGSRPNVGSNKATTIDYGTNFDAMDQAGVLAAHDMGLSGHGVIVGMLDTGFRVTHEALAGIPVLAAWDFVNNDANVDNEGSDPASSVNHGTMTLSTVAGNMPGQLVGPGYGVSVLLAKTEDVSQEVQLEEDHWVAGLEWAEGLGADIISSSLGYIDWYVYDDLDGDTAVTTVAAKLAVGRGLIVVTSAGNDRGTTGYLLAPGDADGVVTVGAVDDTGAISWFSSPGPTADGRIKPDVTALGVSNTVADPGDDANYFTANGTSFSCPLTTGVVALMLERVPGLTPADVLEALHNTASQSSTPDNDQGWGIVDAMAAATWFAPVITLTPLAVEINDPVGPYQVTALITDRVGLDAGSLQVRYRANGGPWQDVPMSATGQPDQFAANIPGQAIPTEVEYYVAAASDNGLASSYPFAGSEAPLYFYVVASSPVGDSGLPTLTHLAANVPNPFNPQTMISFTLARSGPASLRIYDVRGQLVRTLLDGELAAGPHSLRWDGRDRGGRAASSGTYFYRLSGAGQVQQRKMQLVR